MAAPPRYRRDVRSGAAQGWLTRSLTSPDRAVGLHTSALGVTKVGRNSVGTGYGTFTELRHLHVHALKIDRSFVSNMLEDAADDERVVTTIISVAKAFGLATIAEGVESEAVLNRLAKLGWTALRDTSSADLNLLSAAEALLRPRPGTRPATTRPTPTASPYSDSHGKTETADDRPVDPVG